VKKALRLLIAALMLATLVPVSSAAPDGVPASVRRLEAIANRGIRGTILQVNSSSSAHKGV
jgi:hypothetical protein